MEESRRKFLKKSLYTAPVLVVLGQFVTPDSLHADGTGGPDGPPGGWLFKMTGFNKRIRPERETKDEE